MKKLVISLLRRTDRKRSFQKNNLSDYQFTHAYDGSQLVFRDCKAKDGWLEPYKNRPLQQNEVACFMSHASAWQIVANGKDPVIIMEDDAVINEHWNEAIYEDLAKTYDFIYLQRNENEPDLVKSVDDLVEVPGYPYNLTAYVLTPHGAKTLLRHMDKTNMVPVDNFVPDLITEGKLIRAVALKQDHCNQLSREGFGGSDIEDGKPFRNYVVHAVTCGDDRKRCMQVNTSSRMHGIDLRNIGMNVEWKGTDMVGPGGGMKINLLRKFLKTIHPNDVVLFTDAFDVFYADDLETIHERFLHMDADVVFSAESTCWPNASLADQFPESETPYKYLNSGTFIGRANTLLSIINTSDIADDDDDQLFYQKVFLAGKYNIKLDYESYIFQTHEPQTAKIGNQLHNPVTEVCPCIYHGNGGDEAKQVFDNLYKQFYPPAPSLFIPHHNKVDILTPDMLVVDFMTQTQCEDLIAIADKHGGWGSLSYDKFPAQEIRMRELGLWDDLEDAWSRYIVPTVEHYWQPLQMYGLRDGFVMRYAMDTQTNLNLHHDASLVTGSVKLNEDYEGAELVYPRQGISNKDIPVGKMILFPGQVTHGHECLPLRTGVKYSLTIWSCRYVNDNI